MFGIAVLAEPKGFIFKVVLGPYWRHPKGGTPSGYLEQHGKLV